jgi:hypothetical protein
LLFATHSRKFGPKFLKNFKATELFETRITRMVTNLLTMESIGSGQFVRARLARRSLCAKAGEIRVVAPLQPKSQDLEAEIFGLPNTRTFTGMKTCRCLDLKTFAFFVCFVGRKNIRSRL